MAGANRSILLFSLFLGLILMGRADISVCPGGCDYSSIQEAIDAASPGDTICVNSSNYPGGIDLDVGVTLRGFDNGRGRPVLCMKGGPIILSAEGITLRGFKFEPNATSTGILAIRSWNDSLYLNDFPSNPGIICANPCSWNSSHPLKYEYQGRSFTGHMGNYWSDYSGEDINGDGIGDQPMILDSDNADMYPLMQPVESYSIEGERKESAGTINARVGMPFNVTLKCNGDYRWFIDFDHHTLQQVNHSIERGGMETFTFSPMKKGNTHLSAVYRQYWGNIVSDTRELPIVIS